jgi:hypothetical protein
MSAYCLFHRRPFHPIPSHAIPSQSGRNVIWRPSVEQLVVACRTARGVFSARTSFCDDYYRSRWWNVGGAGSTCLACQAWE